MLADINVRYIIIRCPYGLVFLKNIMQIHLKKLRFRYCFIKKFIAFIKESIEMSIFSKYSITNDLTKKHALDYING